MPVLDYKEIPEAHLGGGHQDTFELFARDFLLFLGYEILESPSRGADGGKDVVLNERRSGVGGETCLKWVVSCKHKAHSGASVTPNDENNIRDRVEANKCQGFIGFYSTLPSSGLSDAINGLKDKIETQIFDKEKIESYLLKTPEGIHLARRFFPKSIGAWEKELAKQVDTPVPAQVFATVPALTCKYCGKNLLSPEPSGIIVLWRHSSTRSTKKHTEEIYWCCKGHCDQKLGRAMNGKGLIDGWEDIPDVAIPVIYARWIMSVMNELESGETYSPQAFDQLKEFVLCMYPYIARNPTPKESERIKDLMQLPAFLGGLG